MIRSTKDWQETLKLPPEQGGMLATIVEHVRGQEEQHETFATSTAPPTNQHLEDAGVLLKRTCGKLAKQVKRKAAPPSSMPAEVFLLAAAPLWMSRVPQHDHRRVGLTARAGIGAEGLSVPKL